MIRSGVLVAGIVFAGASASTQKPASESEAAEADEAGGYAPGGGDSGVLLITAERASTLSDPGQLYDLPFGSDPDVEGLTADFLGHAAGEGGTYVSDLEIHLVADEDGKQVDCVARVEPVRHAEKISTPTSESKPVSEQRCITVHGRNGLRDSQDCTSYTRWENVLGSETHVEVGWDVTLSDFSCGPMQRTIDEPKKPNLIRGKVYTSK
jgi:hypothetical protein